MKDMKLIMESWRGFQKEVISEEIALGGGAVSKEADPEKQKDLLARAKKVGGAFLDKKVDDISDSGVVKVVDFLNTPEGKDPKVRAALRAGAEDGKPGDEVINVNDSAAPSVGALSPTQNEISLAKSIGWPLSSMKTLKNVKTGDPTGKGMKIVSSGNLVIDGHHRWSSVWSINPEAKILAVDIDLPGTSADNKLAVAQTAIAATIDTGSGNIPKATTGGAEDNILGANSETIKNMITKLAEEGTIMDSGLALLGDEYMEEVKKSPEGKTYFGLEPNMDNTQARRQIIDRVANNLSNLPAPQGPERDYMPQFDGGDTHDKQVSLDTVVARMKAGDVNYKEPFE